MVPNVIMEPSSDDGRPQTVRPGSMDRERIDGSITSLRVDLAPSRTPQRSWNLTGIRVEAGRRLDGGKTTILLGGPSSRVRPGRAICSCWAWKDQPGGASAVPVARCDEVLHSNNQWTDKALCLGRRGASCTLPGALSCVVAKVGQGDERLGGGDQEKGVCDPGRSAGSAGSDRYIDEIRSFNSLTTN